jgi:ABC-type antimicrobial peptide transport system permease subunit
MGQVLSESEASRRFNTVVIAFFASTAVLLAVLGIYSVIAFSVGSREQEMAIRIALGAQRAEIIRLVATSGAQLALIGCGLGFVGAVASSRLMRSLLFDVSPVDPIVLISSSVVMLLLALAASSLPALRAAQIDPIQTLRGE